MLILLVGVKEGIPNKNKSQCCVVAKIKLRSQKGRTSFKPGLLLSKWQKISGMFSTLVDTKKSSGNGMFPVVSHEVGWIQQEGIGIEYLGGKNSPFPRMLADLHHQNDEKQHF